MHSYETEKTNRCGTYRGRKLGKGGKGVGVRKEKARLPMMMMMMLVSEQKKGLHSIRQDCPGISQRVGR